MTTSVVPLRKTPPRQRPGTALLFVLLGVLPATLLPLSWFVATGALSIDVGFFLLVAVGAGVTAWLGWSFVLPRPGPFLVTDDVVRFPFGRTAVRIALDEIVLCRVVGRDLILVAAVPAGAHPRGEQGGWTLPGGSFVDEDGARRAAEAVRDHLAHRENGAALLQRLDDNERRQRQFQARRPVVTWAVVGACVVGFAVEMATGALRDPATLLRLGANSGARVAQGEAWRLVTACLLHGSVVHLIMNTVSLVPAGAVIERWLGRASIAIVLFCGGVGGHAASALVARTPMSVGISGAVFGLLGVLLVSSLRFRGGVSGGIRVPLSAWLFLLVANGALSLLPFVDVVAHLGGFGCGVVVGLVVTPRPGKPALLPPRGRAACAAVVALATALAIGMAVIRGAA